LRLLSRNDGSGRVQQQIVLLVRANHHRSGNEQRNREEVLFLNDM
jgi:hypothetical protein